MNRRASLSRTALEPPVNWKWNDRRNMQPILPSLYLGPLSCAKDPTRLQDAGITTLVSICTPMSYPFLSFESKLTSNAIVVTSENHFFLQYVEQLKGIMDAALSQGDKVLVYCEDGNGISASLVVGYLLLANNWTLEQSLDWVQARRYSVDLRSSYRYGLMQVEDSITAKQSCAEASVRPTIQKAHRGRRRTLDEYERELQEVPSSMG